jgi:hypothetical protein
MTIWKSGLPKVLLLTCRRSQWKAMRMERHTHPPRHIDVDHF